MTSEPDTHRRSLLAASALGVTAIAAPAWITHAFAQSADSATKSAGAPTLAALLERARQNQKPLVALLVPDEADVATRGYLWGEVFAAASDATLADFVLAEWACAARAEIAARFPQLASELTPSKVAVLLETDGREPAARVFALPQSELAQNVAFSAEARGFGGELKRRAAALTAELRAALAGDVAQLERRSAQLAGSKGDVLAGWLVRGIDAGRRPLPPEVDRSAAAIRARAYDVPEHTPRRLAALAQAFLARTWDRALDGGEWSYLPQDPCPPCGMAIVDTTSGEFLRFYTSTKPR